MTVSKINYKQLAKTLPSCIVLATACLATNVALAGDREQAKRIHDRIAGVPPTQAVLDLMEADIAAGDAQAAADRAMENDGFYNVTLKNFVAPWTNEAMSSFVPLNDYTATVIGIVKDNEFSTMTFYMSQTIALV